MPLHTDDTLVFGRLHGLDHAIRGTGADAKMRPGFAHSLMMERVDGQRLRVEDVGQLGIRFEADGM